MCLECSSNGPSTIAGYDVGDYRRAWQRHESFRIKLCIDIQSRMLYHMNLNNVTPDDNIQDDKQLVKDIWADCGLDFQYANGMGVVLRAKFAEKARSLLKEITRWGAFVTVGSGARKRWVWDSRVVAAKFGSPSEVREWIETRRRDARAAWDATPGRSRGLNGNSQPVTTSRRRSARPSPLVTPRRRRPSLVPHSASPTYSRARFEASSPRTIHNIRETTLASYDPETPTRRRTMLSQPTSPIDDFVVGEVALEGLMERLNLSPASTRTRHLSSTSAIPLSFGPSSGGKTNQQADGPAEQPSPSLFRSFKPGGRPLSLDAALMCQGPLGKGQAGSEPYLTTRENIGSCAISQQPPGLQILTDSPRSSFKRQGNGQHDIAHSMEATVPRQILQTPLRQTSRMQPEEFFSDSNRMSQFQSPENLAGLGATSPTSSHLPHCQAIPERFPTLPVESASSSSPSAIPSAASVRATGLVQLESPLSTKRQPWTSTSSYAKWSESTGLKQPETTRSVKSQIRASSNFNLSPSVHSRSSQVPLASQDTHPEPFQHQLLQAQLCAVTNIVQEEFTEIEMQHAKIDQDLDGDVQMD